MTSPKAARDNEDTDQRMYPVTIDGVTHQMPSSSTVKSALSNPILERWKLKTVARQVALSPVLQAQATSKKNWPAVKAALNADTRKADLGTEVHHWTEQIDLGLATVDAVPEALRGFIYAYEACKRDFGIVPVLVERTVYNATWSYAGTLDRIIRLNGYEGSFLADIKTGSGVWPEVAMQLASYAHGEGLVDDFGYPCEQLPADLRTDLGFVIHLHVDNCDLVPVDLTDAWGAFKAVRRSWSWTHQQAKGAVGQPLPLPITIDPEELV